MSGKVYYRFESFQWSKHTDWIITIKKSLSFYAKKIKQIKNGCGFDGVAVSYEWRAFVMCLMFWSWLLSLAPEWSVFGFPHFPNTCQTWLDNFLSSPYQWIFDASYFCCRLYSLTYWHQERVACKRTFRSLDPLLSLSS